MSSSYVLSAEQMAAVDKAAVAELGVPSFLLMENAGRGVAEVVLREARRRRLATPLAVSVVCGAGSNGGDGLVAARHLALRQARVTVWLAVAPSKIAGDAAVALRVLRAAGGLVALEDGSGWKAEEAGTRWQAALSKSDVVVDALLGTGLRDDVRAPLALVIEAMNQADGLKVAIDIPSGLDADTGRARGTVFRADVTATMGARKLGPAVDADAPTGRVEVVTLGVPILPPAALGPFCHWLDPDEMLALLPRRGPSSHKGTAGHLLIIAGSPGKTGAALLVGRAAMRTGAGLATLASTAAGQVALDAKVVELMSASYADGDDADAGSAAVIGALAARMRAIAVGPGIPTGDGMRKLVTELVARSPLPMVVDADALNLLGPQVARVAASAPAPRVLTPHPGEMARLIGRSVADVQADRLASARDLAAAARVVVLLKGPRTLVAAPDGTVFINGTATPALATAGSGDVLTGIIGSLLAQGLDALDAAKVGAVVHGLAGQQAAGALGGEGGVVSADLPEAIPAVMARRRRVRRGPVGGRRARPTPSGQ
jgi:NAD(P)H-hydrate epimerase